jgi:hypothetical protein
MEEDNKPDLKVVKFTRPEMEETSDNISVDLVLDAAKEKLKAGLIAGWTKDGDFYFAMSQGSVSENLMLLETARLMLNEVMLGGQVDE